MAYTKYHPIFLLGIKNLEYSICIDEDIWQEMI